MPVVLTVVLTAAQPLRGSVRDPAGEDREFVGWMGLAQILGELGDRHAPLGDFPLAQNSGTDT